ncbi:MAG: hypothetical protein CRN43_18255, partial [Candidatus Nephrothrix sp. EaCA]
PDGVTIIPWKRGLCLTWDVTVPDTYAMSHLAHTSINAGEAAERAAESKRMKYSTITNTHAFVAVALETGGAWCREGLQLISELGNRIRDATHDPMETSYIFQRISVALQRGNAICISGTLPPLCKEFGGAPKRPVSNGPAKAPSAVPLNPPPVTSAVGHRKQPGLIVQTAITAARIAAGSAVGHTTGAAISVAGGYSDTDPASQAEQMHQNADSKEPDEQILETSLQSEAESDSTQGDNQTTTTTSVPTLNRSNTFTCSYSKNSEEGSSADPTKERQSSTRSQKTLSKQCASDETKQTSRLPTTSLQRHALNDVQKIN